MSNIISSSDLQSFMNQTLTEALATQICDAVNAYVETTTHRCWGETTQVTENFDYKQTLWLRHQDVVSVDEIQTGFPHTTLQTLDATSYWCNSLGRLTLYGSLMSAAGSGSQSLRDYLTVKYTYGVKTPPDDLKQAALGVAAGLYNWASNGNKDVVSATVGNYRLQYSGSVRDNGSGKRDPSRNTSDLNFAVIDSYRMQRQ